MLVGCLQLTSFLSSFFINHLSLYLYISSLLRSFFLSHTLSLSLWVRHLSVVLVGCLLLTSYLSSFIDSGLSIYEYLLFLSFSFSLTFSLWFRHLCVVLVGRLLLSPFSLLFSWFCSLYLHILAFSFSLTLSLWVRDSCRTPPAQLFSLLFFINHLSLYLYTSLLLRSFFLSHTFSLWFRHLCVVLVGCLLLSSAGSRHAHKQRVSCPSSWGMQYYTQCPRRRVHLYTVCPKSLFNFHTLSILWKLDKTY